MLFEAYEAGRVVVLDGGSIAKSLQDGVGLQQLAFQLALNVIVSSDSGIPSSEKRRNDDRGARGQSVAYAGHGVSSALGGRGVDGGDQIIGIAGLFAAATSYGRQILDHLLGVFRLAGARLAAAQGSRAGEVGVGEEGKNSERRGRAA